MDAAIVAGVQIMASRSWHGRWLLHALSNASDEGCAWRERGNRRGSHGWLAGFGWLSLVSEEAVWMAWPFK